MKAASSSSLTSPSTCSCAMANASAPAPPSPMNGNEETGGRHAAIDAKADMSTFLTLETAPEMTVYADTMGPINENAAETPVAMMTVIIVVKSPANPGICTPKMTGNVRTT